MYKELKKFATGEKLDGIGVLPDKQEKKLMWNLYKNEDQDILYACAYSEDEIKKISEYYSSGIWYEYDLIDDKFLVNERSYTKKVKFPKKPKERKKLETEEIKYKWIDN